MKIKRIKMTKVGSFKRLINEYIISKIDQDRK